MTEKSPDFKNEYVSDDLIVYWEPGKCSHVGKCWQGLPEVFKVGRKPWVDLTQASPEEIIKVIDTCPTRALTYRLTENSTVDSELANGPGAYDYKSPLPLMAKIRVVKDGPLLFEGHAQIWGHDKVLLEEGDSFVLCRCGLSKNTPFCDGSHRDSWKDDA